MFVVVVVAVAVAVVVVVAVIYVVLLLLFCCCFVVVLLLLLWFRCFVVISLFCFGSADQSMNNQTINREMANEHQQQPFTTAMIIPCRSVVG